MTQGTWRFKPQGCCELGSTLGGHEDQAIPFKCLGVWENLSEPKDSDSLQVTASVAQTACRGSRLSKTCHGGACAIAFDEVTTLDHEILAKKQTYTIQTESNEKNQHPNMLRKYDTRTVEQSV